MKKNVPDHYFETVFCEDYDFTCKISKKIIQYLLNSSLLYCATLSNKFYPQISPVIYAYKMNNCSISFLISKNSKEAENLRKNPFLSLSTDLLDKKNPSLNTGLMIQGVAYFSSSKEEIKENLYQIRKRYTEFNIPQIVDQYLVNTTNKKENMIHKSYILVHTKIIKIVYWKGPVFLRQFSLICPARKFLAKQNPNFPPELMIYLIIFPVKSENRKTNRMP
jgi:nitroimidazol reductase NimA-like FMN-containing flavoprotein (pyridoxamine 5'-phosphate oxidase superfamily)